MRDALRWIHPYRDGMTAPAVGHHAILVSHSLLSYREAIASWLRLQRPSIRVVECEPSILDLARARYKPGLVICDAPTPEMRRKGRSLAWIQLHPADGGDSRVHVSREERSAPDLSLPDILEIVDVLQRRRGAWLPRRSSL